MEYLPFDQAVRKGNDLLDGNEYLAEAAQVMADKAIHSIWVEGPEEYLGIFTNTDLVNRVVAKEGLDPQTTTALSVATFPILVIVLCLTPEEAKEKMLHHKVKRMAVTKGENLRESSH